LTVPVGRGVEVRQDDGNVVVDRASDAPEHRAMHGLTSRLIQNAGTGVTVGFTKTLVIQGVGYRGALQGQDINLQVGYSHPVAIRPRDGIDFEMPNPTTIVVRGIDKQKVGQTAAEIRKVRPPEPYKGKGIRYQGEQVRRKAGTTGAK
jgi:large subunit ribosomal protein L6